MSTVCNSKFTWSPKTDMLTLSWPAGHIFPTYKRVFFKSAGIMVSHFFSMLPFTLKYLYSVEPVRMHFPVKRPCTNGPVCNAACDIAHSIICTVLYRWYCVQCSIAALHTVSFVQGCFAGKCILTGFNGIEILQGRWQHEEKVGYCYPSGLEKTLC